MIAPAHRDRAHVNLKLKLLTEAGHFQVQISAYFGFARWLVITAEDDQPPRSGLTFCEPLLCLQSQA